jgi:D-aspartate ligase
VETSKPYGLWAMTTRAGPRQEIARAPVLASDTAVPVLVLKVGRYVLHDHGGLGIARSLGRLGVPVYGVVEDRFAPAVASRYLTGAFTWDTRGLSTQQLLEGMAIIGERLRRPAIVIPTDDAAAIFLAEEAATLQRWFLFPHQPPALPRTLANKRELFLLCKRIGVACPDAVFPTSVHDVRKFVSSAVFPVMVKATERHAESTRTSWIAQTPDELYAIYRSMESQPGGELIFQEYIPPAYGEDWFYHGYRNTDSGSHVGFTGRKLRSHPPYAGPTTLGQAVVNEPLRQQAEALLHAISYSGIMDLDYRLDTRDGQYKLLDFNPRIGAQFRLFQSDTGVDVARALYLDLTGRPVPRSLPPQARTFIVEPYDLLASLTYFWRGGLTLREWRASVTGARELAWFSRDDPLPFLVMCIRLMLRGVERTMRVRPAAHPAYRTPRYARGLPHWITRSAPVAAPARRTSPSIQARGRAGSSRRSSNGSMAAPADKG